jgi:hypothetical protein
LLISTNDKKVALICCSSLQRIWFLMVAERVVVVVVVRAKMIVHQPTLIDSFLSNHQISTVPQAVNCLMCVIRCDCFLHDC